MRRRKRANQPTDGRGFTLIELLVVMFIMAVIVALIVGVGPYVTDSAAKKETQATQAIIMRAIEAYQEEDPNSSPPHASNTKELVTKLRESDKASAILNEASADAISGEDGTIQDGFGETMKYDSVGGLGGTPVLISPGPDRRFGSEGDKYGHDDIRSDR
jgi:prepilin-type N-terminal cleavage/methylation domain-containing protein